MQLDVTVQNGLVGLATITVTTFGGIVLARLRQIHVLANSNLTIATTRLDAALLELKTMKADLDAANIKLVAQATRIEVLSASALEKSIVKEVLKVPVIVQEAEKLQPL